MNFAFTEEQEELRNFVRSFLEEKSPETTVRELMETDDGYDPAVWSQMAEQLGLQALIIPEEYGGQGASYVELGIVLEEMGRSLLCSPYFSTVVLAGNAILHSGNEKAKEELLEGIASGEIIATLALAEAGGTWDADGVEVEATDTGDSATISGEKMFVTDGGTANLFVVAARCNGGIHLFTVEGDAAGLSRENLATMDQTRKQARITFDNTPAKHLCDTDNFAYIDRVLDLAAVALASEQVGGAQFRARHGRAVREGPCAVRPPDRLVPGHQAQVRRHAARGRVGEVGRLLRGLVRSRDERRAAVGGLAGQGLLL